MLKPRKDITGWKAGTGTLRFGLLKTELYIAIYCKVGRPRGIREVFNAQEKEASWQRVHAALLCSLPLLLDKTLLQVPLLWTDGTLELLRLLLQGFQQADYILWLSWQESDVWLPLSGNASVLVSWLFHGHNIYKKGWNKGECLEKHQNIWNLTDCKKMPSQIRWKLSFITSL